MLWLGVSPLRQQAEPKPNQRQSTSLPLLPLPCARFKWYRRVVY